MTRDVKKYCYVISNNNGFSRDLRESRQRYDSMMSELKRKESIMRELQQRLEANEGCKCCFVGFYFHFFLDMVFVWSLQ